MRKTRMTQCVLLAALCCLCNAGCVDLVTDGLTGGITDGISDAISNFVQDIVEGVIETP